MTKKKKSIGGIIFRILISIILGVLGIIFLVFAGWNGLKYWVFHDYYAIKTNLNVNPGLNDGYIPQGTQYLSDKEMYLTSGYMKDGSASRLYTIDKDKKSHYASVYRLDENGNWVACDYHFGGVARKGDYVYVVGGEKINVLNLEEVLTQDKVLIQQTLTINNQGSFIFIKNNDLYVGEFHDGKHYITEHPYVNTDKETTNAIVTHYSLTQAGSISTILPLEEFAIRNQVQGFCVTDNGNIVLSTSYGAAPSHFYVYTKPDYRLITSDDHDGIIPVNYLDSRYLKKTLKAPSMAEDLDYYDGKVIYGSESASMKYLYGKLFFYNYIYGLSVD